MKGREKVYAKKAVHGIHKKTQLQQENRQMLCCVFNIAYADDLSAYKADVGADMGRNIYRLVQAVYYREVFIKKRKAKKQMSRSTKTDSRMMS